MVKAHPVKPVQPFERADPQIAKPVLNDGGDAIVAEAILHIEMHKALFTPVAGLQLTGIEQAYKHNTCAYRQSLVWSCKVHRF